jgi:hypothetical protein
VGLSGPCTRVCNSDCWARFTSREGGPEVAWAVDLVTALPCCRQRLATVAKGAISLGTSRCFDVIGPGTGGRLEAGFRFGSIR